MAKKKSMISLNLMAGENSISLPGVPKDYIEAYNQVKEVDNSNTPVEVFKFADALAGDSFRGAKQLILANEGHGGLEIQLKYDAWANGTPDSNGSAVYTNFLLGCGEYLTFNDSGIVNFDENTSAANAYTRDNDSLDIKGYSDTGVPINEELDSSETELTLDANNAYYFKPGDYIIINPSNNVGAWSTTGPEIIKVVAILSGAGLTIERGMLGTTARAHANNSSMWWIDANLTPTIGGFQYQNENPENEVEGQCFGILMSDSVSGVENSPNPDLFHDTSSLGAVKAGRITNSTNESKALETNFVSRRHLIATVNIATLHADDDIDAFSASGTKTLITSLLPTTNSFGQYRSGQFPGGYGRGNTQISTGIVPGSVAIKFAVGGQAKFGLRDASGSTPTGLIPGESYRFDLECNGRSETIAFTVGTDTTLGGVVGLIQQALIDLPTTPWAYQWDSPQFFYGGRDLICKTFYNMHTLGGLIQTNTAPTSGVSTVRLSNGTAGNEQQLFGRGIFPLVPPLNDPSYFPDDNIMNPDTGEMEIDPRNFMFDDGNGNLYVTGDTNINLSNAIYAGWAMTPYTSSGGNGGGGRASIGGLERIIPNREREVGEHDHSGGDHTHEYALMEHQHHLNPPRDTWGTGPDPGGSFYHLHQGAGMPPEWVTGVADGFTTAWGEGNTFNVFSETAVGGGWNTRDTTRTEHGHSGGGHGHPGAGNPPPSPRRGGGGRKGRGGPIAGSYAGGWPVGPDPLPHIPFPMPQDPYSTAAPGSRDKIYTGRINYETGALWIGWAPAYAEMKFSCSYNSAMSGNIVTSAASSNGIQSIYARSTNQKTNGNLRIIALR